MYIIIVGCGRVGSQLANMLAQEGHDVVIIDKNPKAFERLGATFNGLTLTGVGFDPDLLKEAGIEKADALAAVTSGDNSNIMVAQIASRLFKVEKIITRVYDPERAHIYKRFGLETICTTTIGAALIKNMLLHKTITSHLTLGKDGLLIEFKIPDKFVAQKFDQIRVEGFNPSAIIREEEMIIPGKDTTLKKDDSIIGVAKVNTLPKIKKFFGL